MGFQSVSSIQINKNKTKKLVENVLITYSKLIHKIKLKQVCKQFDSSFLQDKIKVGEQLRTVEEFLKQMDIIFSALSEKQKSIIAERYIKNSGDTLDCDVLDLVDLSQSTYYREKLKAILVIAELLNIAVYEQI